MINTTFDNELILVAVDRLTQDEDLNEVPKIRQRKILCCEKSLSKDEFFSARQSGLKSNKTLSIHTFEYDGERYCIYENQVYEIERVSNFYQYYDLTVGESLGTSDKINELMKEVR